MKTKVFVNGMMEHKTEMIAYTVNLTSALNVDRNGKLLSMNNSLQVSNTVGRYASLSLVGSRAWEANTCAVLDK